MENGVTNGTTKTTFSPDAPCTRAQLATFLWRAAGEPEPALTEQQFMDVTDPSAYYYKAVQWAAEKDMWGFGTFDPHVACTRLDAVFFLWRANGSPKMDGEFPFADVPFGDGDEHGQPIYWHADQAVLWAVGERHHQRHHGDPPSPPISPVPGPGHHLPVPGRAGGDYRKVRAGEPQAKKAAAAKRQPPPFIKSARVQCRPDAFC